MLYDGPPQCLRPCVISTNGVSIQALNGVGFVIASLYVGTILFHEGNHIITLQTL